MLSVRRTRSCTRCSRTPGGIQKVGLCGDAVRSRSPLTTAVLLFPCHTAMDKQISTTIDSLMHRLQLDHHQTSHEK